MMFRITWIIAQSRLNRHQRHSHLKTPVSMWGFPWISKLDRHWASSPGQPWDRLASRLPGEDRCCSISEPKC